MWLDSDLGQEVVLDDAMRLELHHMRHEWNVAPPLEILTHHSVKRVTSKSHHFPCAN